LRKIILKQRQLEILKLIPILLGRWVNEFKEDDGHAFRDNGKLTPEQLELRQP